MRAEDTIATRESLLERLRHASNQVSWREFFDRYWNLIYSAARRAGLREAEAQDAVQETILVVARKIDVFKYDPSVASFKTWLLRITRFCILKQLGQRARQEKGIQACPEETTGDNWLEEIPDPTEPGLETIWEDEWRKHLYQAAIEEVKRKVSPAQFQVFDLYVNKQWSVQAVARLLDLSAARVYLAKHRIARLIQKEVQRLSADPKAG